MSRSPEPSCDFAFGLDLFGRTCRVDMRLTECLPGTRKDMAVPTGKRGAQNAARLPYHVAMTAHMRQPTAPFAAPRDEAKNRKHLAVETG